MAGLTTPGTQLLDLEDAVILSLYDRNGKQRVSLNGGKAEQSPAYGPSITLSDTNGMERAILTARDDNTQQITLGKETQTIQTGGGSLMFKSGDPNGMSNGVVPATMDQTGIFLARLDASQKEGGWTSLHLGTLMLAGNEANISVTGAGFTTAIGNTDLVTPRTGETHKTSAASVVLFDKDSKVLWKAP